MALGVLQLCGGGPRRLMAGVMAVTALLCMWVSNTATAMMMLPIALSIISTVRLERDSGTSKFATALLLSVAYAATIGGMGTLVGTPPNALFAAYMEDVQGVKIGFGQWMLLGLPLVTMLLPVAWLTLITVFGIPAHGGDLTRNAIDRNLANAFGRCCERTAIFDLEKSRLRR